MGGSEGRDTVKEITFQWDHAPKQGFPVSTEVANVEWENFGDNVSQGISGGAGVTGVRGATWAESAMVKGDSSSSSSAMGTALGRVPE